MLFYDVTIFTLLLTVTWLPDFTGVEMSLVTHVEQRTLSELEMIHGFGSLTCQDYDSELIGKGPVFKGLAERSMEITMGPNQQIAPIPDLYHFRCL